MQSVESDEHGFGWSIDAWKVAAVLTFFVFYTPIIFNISSTVYEDIRFEVLGPVWRLWMMTDTPLIIGVDFQLLFTFLPIVALRFIFVNQTYKCYKGLVTRKKAIIVGIVTELPLIVIIILLYLFSVGLPAHTIPIMAPIPILFLIGLLFLFITPPRKPALQWIEKEQLRPEQESYSEV